MANPAGKQFKPLAPAMVAVLVTVVEIKVNDVEIAVVVLVTVLVLVVCLLYRWMASMISSSSTSSSMEESSPVRAENKSAGLSSTLVTTGTAVDWILCDLTERIAITKRAVRNLPFRTCCGWVLKYTFNKN